MGFWSAVGTFFTKIGEAWAAADTLQKIQYVLTAVTLAVGVKGFLQARNMLNKGQDILANKTSMGGKIPVIYGTRRVGAQIIYMDVNANDSRDMYVVYALSVGECDEILGKTIELDGNPLSDSARFRNGGYIGSDKIASGSGSLNTVSQNGTNSLNLTGGTFGTDPTAKYRYVMNLHHGAASQTADPMLVASMSNWTSLHRLDGICYICAHYGYDKEGMWRGVPQLTVQVRGKKVFDPRDNTQTFGTVSTYKHSDNPALCFLDWITNDSYGKGLTSSQINMSTFSTAANVCDTQVDQPYFNGSAKNITWEGVSGNNFINITGTNANEVWWQNKVGELMDLEDAAGNAILNSAVIEDVQRTHFYDSSESYAVYFKDTLGSTYSSQNGQSLLKVKRFHCNGYVDTNKNVMENAKELLANMRGIFLYIDGKYELSIEDTGSSTFSITDDHIIADSGISVDYGNKDKKANKVIVEFFNANKKYELDTATVLHDASPNYTSDDGGEVLEVKAEFPYVSDPYIAYNMAKAILTRSRNQTSIQFLGTPEMYKLNVGDIVDLTYAGLGFNGKICRVEALELQSEGLIAVSLIEYFDVYTWEVPPQEPVEELANLPSAFAAKAPTGLSFTDSGSSSTGRPFLTWTEPTDFPDHQYRIRIVDSSSNKLTNKIVDQEFVDLDFIPVGSNYVASVSSINTLGVESDAATLTFSVSTAPVATGDVKDDAITLAKVGTDVESAINAGGTNSTQLIKATSAPSTRSDGSSLQAQDIWADTNDNNQVYVRNAANNGWEKARDSSLISLYNSLNSTVTSQGTALATAQSDIVTVTNSASSNASSISSLTSSVNGNSSSISTNASAITNINGNAAASYVLKLDANGKVAQMVLNSNASTGSGATSTVAFLADTFKIDNDAGSSVSPFVVSGGSVFIDNARINNLSGTKIDVDTLAVKYFADVTSKIYNHNNTAVPLTRVGSNYIASANTGSSGVHTCAPVSITNCRSGGSFVAYVQGILGDVANMVVEYSTDGSSYSNATGQVFTISAGTYRGYTLLYNGTLTFSGSDSTAYFRVKFNGNQNYTQIGLTVTVDNTN
jgi:hypothetical protein